MTLRPLTHLQRLEAESIHIMREVVAEGVETEAEARALEAIGIRYMQGYQFARHAFEALPPITLNRPSVRARAA